MKKAVLISIRPKWCQKIADGEKTIEIRKTRPRLETPFKCYIYCTQGGVALGMWGKHGKVIGEFVCDQIDTLAQIGYMGKIDRWLDSVGTILIGKGLSSYGELIGCLEDAPAADVAPVRHGRWKKSGSLLECQYCGEIYSQLGGNAGKSWNYCPNCGAKMDGVAENG